ncbi:MAG: hypothetical protein RLZZ367_2393 [Bacteroidota bacterium]|jgi:hypothetical protein
MTTTTQNTPKQKRYVITLSFYQHSATDTAAITEAMHFADALNRQHDCRATVDAIVESAYGKIGNRKVM